MQRLLDIFQRQNAQIERISQVEPLRDSEELAESTSGELWEQWKQKGHLTTFTCLTASELEAMYLEMLPFIASERCRGPKPKSSWMDVLLCYLLWAHSSTDTGILANSSQMKEGHFEENIARIRPILLFYLKTRWRRNKEKGHMLNSNQHFLAGYVGPPSDTPNERRVVPIRPARLHHEIDFNNRISQFRVPIEQFFTRVTKL